jgi:hypothetical protein
VLDSPDNLAVSRAGMTFAIWGPWKRGAFL